MLPFADIKKGPQTKLVRRSNHACLLSHAEGARLGLMEGRYCNTQDFLYHRGAATGRPCILGGEIPNALNQ